MRCINCFHCGYFQEEEKEDGMFLYYCKDKDCYVDPFDPACNYE